MRNFFLVLFGILVFVSVSDAQKYIHTSELNKKDSTCKEWIDKTTICKYLDTNSIGYKLKYASPGRDVVQRKVKDGIYHVYFLQDTTRLAVEYVYMNYLLQSIKRYWFNGQIEYEGSYKDGRQFGEFYNYAENGIKLSMHYYDGRGIWSGENYFPDGTVESEWHRDEKNLSYNVHTYYYENGIVKASGRTRNGYKEGFWFYYDEQGKLVNKKKHKPGKDW